jgi:hypothetical protein
MSETGRIVKRIDDKYRKQRQRKREKLLLIVNKLERKFKRGKLMYFDDNQQLRKIRHYLEIYSSLPSSYLGMLEAMARGIRIKTYLESIGE